MLPRLLQEVTQAYPNLKLRIEDVATDMIAPRVRSGLCDLGVGTFHSEEEGLDTQRILRDRLMVFIDPEHAFRLLEEVEWSALADAPIITLTRESNIRLLTEIGFETAGIALRPHLEVHQITTALSLVESGAGLAVLPAYAFAALNGRKIAARPLTGPAITRDVSIITARERTPSAATTVVRGMMRRVIRDMVPEIP